MDNDQHWEPRVITQEDVENTPVTEEIRKFIEETKVKCFSVEVKRCEDEE